MFHKPGRRQRTHDDHGESGGSIADGCPYKLDGNRLYRRKEYDKRDRADNVDDDIKHPVNNGILKQAPRPRPPQDHAKDQAEQPADYKGDAYYPHSLAKRLQQGPILYVPLKVAKIRCICSNHYAVR